MRAILLYIVNHGLTQLKVLNESLCSDIDTSEGFLKLTNNNMLVKWWFANAFYNSRDNSIGVVILKHQLQCPENAVRMSTQRLSHRSLSVDSVTSWKMRRDNQFESWIRGIKESSIKLLTIGTSRIFS